ncbi:Rv3235 family protein [Actinokineospora auranticolor]|uniref:Uncharacterized protein n=1 Tax=Actinokineospora auranticolor TaxID=155976 RepID=A0A2S6GXC0_9PSEU|nr:Rv3235 family protein [Actinokineospora auranticolor]PPK69837.1 hypothetical protein CLV40_103447 [Actinokineospora auranticolor]
MRIEPVPDYDTPVPEAFEERWTTPPAWVPGPRWTIATPTRHTTWRMLTMLLEALDGRRPLAHLHASLAPQVYEAMLTRTHNPRTHHRLSTLHTFEPAPGIVEIAATIRVHPLDRTTKWRLQALAGRLEQTSGTWICTLLRPVGF